MFGKLPLVIIQVKGARACYAGSVPRELCIGREPTTSDVMGGRVASDGLAYHSRNFETVEEAYQYAIAEGFHAQKTGVAT